MRTELLQNSADFEASGSRHPLPWITTTAQQQGSSGVSDAPALQCSGGSSADIYSCTPRESNSPIWKHRSSEGARSGCGNSKQQETDIWGFIKVKPLQGCDTDSPHLPLQQKPKEHASMECLRCAWGQRVGVLFPCTRVYRFVCGDRTPRAAQLHLIFPSPCKAPRLGMAQRSSFHHACSALGNGLRNP